VTNLAPFSNTLAGSGFASAIEPGGCSIEVPSETTPRFGATFLTYLVSCSTGNASDLLQAGSGRPDGQHADWLSTPAEEAETEESEEHSGVGFRIPIVVPALIVEESVPAAAGGGEMSEDEESTGRSELLQPSPDNLFREAAPVPAEQTGGTLADIRPMPRTHVECQAFDAIANDREWTAPPKPRVQEAKDLPPLPKAIELTMTRLSTAESSEAVAHADHPVPPVPTAGEAPDLEPRNLAPAAASGRTNRVSVVDGPQARQQAVGFPLTQDSPGPDHHGDHSGDSHTPHLHKSELQPVRGEIPQDAPRVATLPSGAFQTSEPVTAPVRPDPTLNGSAFRKEDDLKMTPLSAAPLRALEESSLPRESSGLSTELRSLHLEFEQGGTGRTRVVLEERRGSIHVTIGAAADSVRAEIQRHLPDLVSSLEKTGWEIKSDHTAGSVDAATASEGDHSGGKPDGDSERGRPMQQDPRHGSSSRRNQWRWLEMWSRSTGSDDRLT